MSRNLETEIRNESFAVDTRRNFSMGSVAGRNVRDKVLPYALDHMTGAEANALRLLNTFIKKSLVKKVKNLKLGAGKRLEDKHNKLTCDLCGNKGLGKGRYVWFVANGRKIGENIFAGEDCIDKTRRFINGIPHQDYEGPEENIYGSPSENYESIRIPLTNLPKRIQNSLKAEGFNLEELVEPEILRDLQKQVRRSDYSGVEGAIDPGRFRGIVDWYKGQLKEGTLYSEYIHMAAQNLLERPDRLTPEQSAALLFYQFRERKLPREVVAGEILKDIERFAKDKKINLNKETKVNAFDGGEPDKDIVANLINPKKYSHLTRAQVLAIKKAIPGLLKLRSAYNKAAVARYAGVNEFNSLTSELFNRVVAFREAELAEKRDGIPNSMTSWSEVVYKKLFAYYKDQKKALEIDPRLTIHKHFLQNIDVDDAEILARIIYVESKKLEMAYRLGKPYLISQPYTTIKELRSSSKGLEKLAHIALETGKTNEIPKHTRERLRKVGFNKYEGIDKILESIKESAPWGLVPAGKLDLDLERLLMVSEDFKESPKTVKEVEYLRLIRDSFVRHDSGVRSAETGKLDSKKTSTKFNLDNYFEKTYFTQEQIETIGEVYLGIPHEIKNLTKSEIKRAEEAYKKLETFYERHKGKVFSSTHPLYDYPGDFVIFEEEMPTVKDKYMVSGKIFKTNFKHRPIRSILERGKNINFYKPINLSIKAQLLYLLDAKLAGGLNTQNMSLRKSPIRKTKEFIEQIVDDSDVMISSSLRDEIQRNYVRLNGPKFPKDYLDQRSS